MKNKKCKITSSVHRAFHGSERVIKTIKLLAINHTMLIYSRTRIRYQISDLHAFQRTNVPMYSVLYIIPYAFLDAASNLIYVQLLYICLTIAARFFISINNRELKYLCADWRQLEFELEKSGWSSDIVKTNMEIMQVKVSYSDIILIYMYVWNMKEVEVEAAINCQFRSQFARAYQSTAG